VGVIDGFAPLGIETAEDVKWRHDLLRKMGYKA
jgi:adenosine/AMP kinase